jgi:hypothetical protein
MIFVTLPFILIMFLSSEIFTFIFQPRGLLTSAGYTRIPLTRLITSKSNLVEIHVMDVMTLFSVLVGSKSL